MLHINKRKKTVIGSVAKLQSTGIASENMHPHLQAEMFKIHIRPILYYAIENYHLSEYDMKTIKRIEGNALKRLIGISTHCKSTDLFFSFNMMMTVDRIKWLKLKHFIRMSRNELTNSLLVELENKYIKNSFIEEIKEITSEVTLPEGSTLVDKAYISIQDLLDKNEVDIDTSKKVETLKLLYNLSDRENMRVYINDLLDSEQHIGSIL